MAVFGFKKRVHFYVILIVSRLCLILGMGQVLYLVDLLDWFVSCIFASPSAS